MIIIIIKTNFYHKTIANKGSVNKLKITIFAPGYLKMHIDTKILFFCFILVLFLVPNFVFGCATTIKTHNVKMSLVALDFRQLSAELQSECSRGDCKDECCHPQSHNCQSDGCSGSCSGNLCSSAQYTVLADSKFLEDSKNEAAAFGGKKANFYYQNPHYSGGFYTIWEPPKIG